MYSRICCHSLYSEVHVYGLLTKDTDLLKAGQLDILSIYPATEVSEALDFASKKAIEFNCVLGCSSGIIKEGVS